MKISRIFFLLILLLAPLLSNSATLNEGTLIPVRLTQNVNGNINQLGETVYFQVTEDILVGDDRVIRQGTFIKGKISEATGRKSLGKAGKLSLIAKGLKTETGQNIRFVQDPMAAEGRKRTGATVAHVVMWGPLGLFAKGRAAFIFLDTEYDLEISHDVELPPLTTVLDDQEEAFSNAETDQVKFEHYRKKINYRKGKIQDDFVLNIQVEDETVLNQNSVKITRILDYDLPKIIEPVSVQYNSKKKYYEAIFSFREMIKYITPGVSRVTVEIGVENPDVYSAILETKWKLK